MAIIPPEYPRGQFGGKLVVSKQKLAVPENVKDGLVFNTPPGGQPRAAWVPKTCSAPIGTKSNTENTTAMSSLTNYNFMNNSL